MTPSDASDDPPTSSTLLVTVGDSEEAYQHGLKAIERLDREEDVDDPDRHTFPTVDLLFETFTPLTMEILRTIADAEPNSIRETARLVDRDVKNVHDELMRLERLGVVRFDRDGQAKRPVLPYDELVISLPFDRDQAADIAPASS